MAVLEIKKFNDPVLRKKCKEVRKIDKKIKRLIVDMAQTMERNAGVGLASPQVGVLKRIIVVKTDLEGRKILGLVNPKILKRSEETEIDEEGCLSFPGIFLKIIRAKEAEVEGLDIKGKKIRIKTKGLTARIFQHEIDHLDGILFIDRISFWQRWKIRNKLRKLGI